MVGGEPVFLPQFHQGSKGRVRHVTHLRGDGPDPVPRGDADAGIVAEGQGDRGDILAGSGRDGF